MGNNSSKSHSKAQEQTQENPPSTTIANEKVGEQQTSSGSPNLGSAGVLDVGSAVADFAGASSTLLATTYKTDLEYLSTAATDDAATAGSDQEKTHGMKINTATATKTAAPQRPDDGTHSPEETVGLNEGNDEGFILARQSSAGDGPEQHLDSPVSEYTTPRESVESIISHLPLLPAGETVTGTSQASDTNNPNAATSTRDHHVSILEPCPSATATIPAGHHQQPLRQAGDTPNDAVTHQGVPPEGSLTRAAASTMDSNAETQVSSSAASVEASHQGVTLEGSPTRAAASTMDSNAETQVSSVADSATAEKEQKLHGDSNDLQQLCLSQDYDTISRPCEPGSDSSEGEDNLLSSNDVVLSDPSQGKKLAEDEDTSRPVDNVHGSSKADLLIAPRGSSLEFSEVPQDSHEKSSLGAGSGGGRCIPGSNAQLLQGTAANNSVCASLPASENLQSAAKANLGESDAEKYTCESTQLEDEANLLESDGKNSTCDSLPLSESTQLEAKTELAGSDGKNSTFDCIPVSGSALSANKADLIESDGSKNSTCDSLFVSESAQLTTKAELAGSDSKISTCDSLPVSESAQLTTKAELAGSDAKISTCDSLPVSESAQLTTKAELAGSDAKISTCDSLPVSQSPQSATRAELAGSDAKISTCDSLPVSESAQSPAKAELAGSDGKNVTCDSLPVSQSPQSATRAEVEGSDGKNVTCDSLPVSQSPQSATRAEVEGSDGKNVTCDSLPVSQSPQSATRAEVEGSDGKNVTCDSLPVSQSPQSATRAEVEGSDGKNVTCDSLPVLQSPQSATRAEVAESDGKKRGGASVEQVETAHTPLPTCSPSLTHQEGVPLESDATFSSVHTPGITCQKRVFHSSSVDAVETVCEEGESVQPCEAKSTPYSNKQVNITPGQSAGDSQTGKFPIPLVTTTNQGLPVKTETESGKSQVPHKTTTTQGLPVKSVASSDLTLLRSKINESVQSSRVVDAGEHDRGGGDRRENTTATSAGDVNTAASAEAESAQAEVGDKYHTACQLPHLLHTGDVEDDGPNYSNVGWGNTTPAGPTELTVEQEKCHKDCACQEGDMERGTGGAEGDPRHSKGRVKTTKPIQAAAERKACSIQHKEWFLKTKPSCDTSGQAGKSSDSTNGGGSVGNGGIRKCTHAQFTVDEHKPGHANADLARGRMDKEEEVEGNRVRVETQVQEAGTKISESCHGIQEPVDPNKQFSSEINASGLERAEVAKVEVCDLLHATTGQHTLTAGSATATQEKAREATASQKQKQHTDVGNKTITESSSKEKCTTDDISKQHDVRDGEKDRKNDGEGLPQKQKQHTDVGNKTIITQSSNSKQKSTTYELSKQHDVKDGEKGRKNDEEGLPRKQGPAEARDDVMRSSPSSKQIHADADAAKYIPCQPSGVADKPKEGGIRGPTADDDDDDEGIYTSPQEALTTGEGSAVGHIAPVVPSPADDANQTVSHGTSPEVTVHSSLPRGHGEHCKKNSPQAWDQSGIEQSLKLHHTDVVYHNQGQGNTSTTTPTSPTITSIITQSFAIGKEEKSSNSEADERDRSKHSVQTEAIACVREGEESDQKAGPLIKGSMEELIDSSSGGSRKAETNTEKKDESARSSSPVSNSTPPKPAAAAQAQAMVNVSGDVGDQTIGGHLNEQGSMEAQIARSHLEQQGNIEDQTTCDHLKHQENIEIKHISDHLKQQGSIEMKHISDHPKQLGNIEGEAIGDHLKQPGNIEGQTMGGHLKQVMDAKLDGEKQIDNDNLSRNTALLLPGEDGSSAETLMELSALPDISGRGGNPRDNTCSQLYEEDDGVGGGLEAAGPACEPLPGKRIKEDESGGQETGIKDTQQQQQQRTVLQVNMRNKTGGESGSECAAVERTSGLDTGEEPYTGDKTHTSASSVQATQSQEKRRQAGTTVMVETSPVGELTNKHVDCLPKSIVHSSADQENRNVSDVIDRPVGAVVIVSDGDEIGRSPSLLEGDIGQQAAPLLTARSSEEKEKEELISGNNAVECVGTDNSGEPEGAHTERLARGRQGEIHQMKLRVHFLEEEDGPQHGSNRECSSASPPPLSGGEMHYDELVEESVAEVENQCRQLVPSQSSTAEQSLLQSAAKEALIPVEQHEIPDRTEMRILYNNEQSGVEREKGEEELPELSTSSTHNPRPSVIASSPTSEQQGKLTPLDSSEGAGAVTILPDNTSLPTEGRTNPKVKNDSEESTQCESDVSSVSVCKDDSVLPLASSKCTHEDQSVVKGDDSSASVGNVASSPIGGGKGDDTITRLDSKELSPPNSRGDTVAMFEEVPCEELHVLPVATTRGRTKSTEEDGMKGMKNTPRKHLTLPDLEVTPPCELLTAESDYQDAFGFPSPQRFVDADSSPWDRPIEEYFLAPIASEDDFECPSTDSSSLTGKQESGTASSQLVSSESSEGDTDENGIIVKEKPQAEFYYDWPSVDVSATVSELKGSGVPVTATLDSDTSSEYCETRSQGTPSTERNSEPPVLEESYEGLLSAAIDHSKEKASSDGKGKYWLLLDSDSPGGSDESEANEEENLAEVFYMASGNSKGLLGSPPASGAREHVGAGWKIGDEPGEEAAALLWMDSVQKAADSLADTLAKAQEELVEPPARAKRTERHRYPECSPDLRHHIEKGSVYSYEDEPQKLYSEEAQLHTEMNKNIDVNDELPPSVQTEQLGQELPPGGQSGEPSQCTAVPPSTLFVPTLHRTEKLNIRQSQSLPPLRSSTSSGAAAFFYIGHGRDSSSSSNSADDEREDNEDEEEEEEEESLRECPVDVTSGSDNVFTDTSPGTPLDDSSGPSSRSNLPAGAGKSCDDYKRLEESSDDYSQSDQSQELMMKTCDQYTRFGVSVHQSDMYLKSHAESLYDERDQSERVTVSCDSYGGARAKVSKSVELHVSEDSTSSSDDDGNVSDGHLSTSSSVGSINDFRIGARGIEIR